MGLFNKDNKPQVGEVYASNLPEDLENIRKLKGYHPVVVVEVNEDDSVRVMGCTSKNYDRDDVELLTIPDMPEKTYVRTYQGTKDVENEDLKLFKGKDYISINLEDYTQGL